MEHCGSVRRIAPLISIISGELSRVKHWHSYNGLMINKIEFAAHHAGVYSFKQELWFELIQVPTVGS